MEGECREESAAVVSIHALLRRATNGHKFRRRNQWGFNPRPPAEGDLVVLASVCEANKFQSTPSCGGRLILLSSKNTPSRFQSTPSCGGRLQQAEDLRRVPHVSIHALLRRATEARKKFFRLCAVSIHALLRRATFTSDFRPGLLMFQSTPSCGGRHPFIL